MILAAPLTREKTSLDAPGRARIGNTPANREIDEGDEE